MRIMNSIMDLVSPMDLANVHGGFEQIPTYKAVDTGFIMAVLKKT